MTMAALFWVSVVGIVYPYFAYPVVLWIIGRLARHPAPPSGSPAPPSISMIIPVHNEEARIERKVANTAALRYPDGRLQVVFVSDGSTDRTVEILRAEMTPGMTLVELRGRGGKAAALNAGLERATNDILVFSDAAIALEPNALHEIARPFRDARIGCVSGEDRIGDSGGEGAYGRYELFLRRLESQVHSIVGASGSFYAQRRAICTPFLEGMAPDFLSVIRTVVRGYRAVSEPAAVGSMTSVKDHRHEFDRKARTFLRGMTTLFAHPGVLNPCRVGLFAFSMWSHKLLRWTVPFFLITALVSSLALSRDPWYAAAFIAQVAFYVVAAAAMAGFGGAQRSLAGKIALYFASVNAAILAAWYRYGIGVRQELWTPSHR